MEEAHLMENPLLRQGNEVPRVMKAEVHSVDSQSTGLLPWAQAHVPFDLSPWSWHFVKPAKSKMTKHDQCNTLTLHRADN